MAANVRPATRDDLPRLVELLSQLSLDAPREPAAARAEHERAFEEIVADPRQRLFVAERDGVVVGTLCLIVVPNLSHRGTPYALIENVVVDESARSSGVGDAMMVRAVAEAKTMGCYKVALTSNKRRPDAHRFYERLGFKATSEGFRLDL
jgi:GNAT superfamily N-acetyltransferase